MKSAHDLLAFPPDSIEDSESRQTLTGGICYAIFVPFTHTIPELLLLPAQNPYHSGYRLNAHTLV